MHYETTVKIELDDPWRWEDGPSFYSVRDCDGALIAEISGGDTQAKEMARLMASVPEMLAVCVAARRLLNEIDIQALPDRTHELAQRLYNRIEETDIPEVMKE